MRKLAAAIAAMTMLMTSGCRVTEHKNGNNENVDIGTPFGGVHVKTNNEVSGGLGLTPYPGAVLEKNDKSGKTDGAADVDMSFGRFHLGVKAASYLTPDSPSMVLAFYKKDMARYGVVLECDGHHAVGSVSRTPEGLTCDDEGSKNRISWSTSDDGSSANELRAGSKMHQHIIGIEKKHGQTKIGMVALDLPSAFTSKSDRDSD